MVYVQPLEYGEGGIVKGYVDGRFRLFHGFLCCLVLHFADEDVELVRLADHAHVESVGFGSRAAVGVEEGGALVGGVVAVRVCRSDEAV